MERPRLEPYLAVVSRKAWATWYKLPPQHRAWIGIDDLIQDGVLFARFAVLPKYRPHRAGFKHFLSLSLENFYKNFLAELFTQKRNQCQLVPVCSVMHRLAADDIGETEQSLKALRGLLCIIQEASPALRQSLNHWLFVHGHLRCEGRKFEIARNELLFLAKRYNFGRDDLEYLLKNSHWQRGLQEVQKAFLLRGPVKA